MFFIELTTLIIGLIYVRKDKIGRFFIAYLAFDLSILLAHWYLITCLSISPEFGSYFRSTTNTIIAYVELLVYFYFFKKIFHGENIKKVLTGLSILYTIIISIFIITKFSFISSRYNFIALINGAIEFVFLLVPCIYYFLQLLKTNSPIKLSERPTFWIVIGIFFFSLISVPYYLLNNYIIKGQFEFRNVLIAVLYYMPLISNFLFLIKAFLCKKPLTI